MKISQLIDDIRKKDLLLPEFQREYVWSREQAKQLLVSLLKKYPVGSLLFWKTDNPPELKNIDNLPEKIGTIQIILDGQQRLTTLYMLFTGEVPPYYTEQDITTDPRDLYFNLDEGDFQYYQASRMKDNLLWWRVIDCFNKSKINVFEIAKQNAKNDQDAFQLAQRYNENLTGLRQIFEIDLKTVKGHSLDGFEQLLSRLVSDHIGTEFSRFIKIRFEQVEGENICAVDVDKAPEPVFMTGPRGKEFFIRQSNTTRALDPEEMHRYIQMNWE